MKDISSTTKSVYKKLEADEYLINNDFAFLFSVQYNRTNALRIYLERNTSLKLDIYDDKQLEALIDKIERKCIVKSSM